MSAQQLSNNTLTLLLIVLVTLNNDESFSKHFLNTCCDPGSVDGARDSVVKNKYRESLSWRWHPPGEINK